MPKTNEEVWEGFNDNEVILQRPCEADCENGMLYAPARFCSACGGDGYQTRTAVIR